MFFELGQDMVYTGMVDEMIDLDEIVDKILSGEEFVGKLTPEQIDYVQKEVNRKLCV